MQHGLGRSEGRRCPLLPLRRRPARQNPLAGNLRQPDLRRTDAQPVVHVREHLGLCVLRRRPGRIEALIPAKSNGPGARAGAVFFFSHRRTIPRPNRPAQCFGSTTDTSIVALPGAAKLATSAPIAFHSGVAATAFKASGLSNHNCLLWPSAAA